MTDALKNAATSPAARRAAHGLTRVGIAARGILYALLGLITLLAAAHLQRARGPKGTLVALLAYPAGRIVVFLLAVGFLSFAVAHLFALFTPHGSPWKIWGERTLHLFLLATYASLALFAFTLALYRTGGNPHQTRDWVEWLFSWPGGRIALLLIALGIAGFGGFEEWRAALGSSRQELPGARLLVRSLWRFGIAARGALFIGVAFALARVAFDNKPQQAGGMGDVLRALIAYPAARPLMLLLAAGLMSYGLVELLIARRGEAPETAPANAAAAPAPA